MQITIHNQEMLNVIIAGLSELPIKVGLPVLNELERQVNAFNAESESENKEKDSET